MNRFRTKRKGRDDASIGGRPSMEAETSGPFRLFGKKKAQDEEPKPEVDLATVLPPSDDFRTSLLMTGLSARFSMLREQDDPHSKIGKASDDSVLFPKRQSRLTDYGVGGLHDIAEIESLKAPALGRFDPYQSDDASSITGSIMSRAKPTEGNNLFGGRQKIYKLTAGSRAGMSGRALYDDDVAQSAFQKWRRTEKETKPLEEGEVNDATEVESATSHNRRRETSSTSSSVPSAAQASTAATSIISRPSSAKESQSAGQLSGLERSVTRTRRLYEQGLNQDLQGHQSSALSRMDTLSKQRTFGSRADANAMPSPTASLHGDRSTDRRQLLSKASAPSLRSISASTNGSTQMSPLDAASRFLKHDSKAPFGANPPLSPPISETEDHPALAIRPGDHGKATAMGVFSRPAMQYDESRYAQRQRQLQKSRDASTSRGTTESAESSVGDRSRSSSAQRLSTEKLRTQGSISELRRNEEHGSLFFDESDDGQIDQRVTRRVRGAPQLTIERPHDHDHPAFRKSALPTPLSIISPKDTDENAFFSPFAQTRIPGESPALSPNAGLSGMVRQHLRNDSTASSVYGPPTHELVYRGNDTTAKFSPRSIDYNVADDDQQVKRDEFAQYLADGARRVRERLTTYVESDNDRSAPPTPPLSEPNKDASSSKSSGLGILGSKSSRGSLAEKGDKERGRAANSKTSSSQPRGMGASPSPRKASGSRGGSRTREADGKAGEERPSQPEETIHVGLKAFRQARRELQRMKELEVQQRHSQKSGHQDGQSSSRAGHGDSGPPPAYYNRMAREDQSFGNRSRAGSRATSERDRSGSETSNGGRAYSYGSRYGNSMESPASSPYKVGGGSQVGMSPSHSAGNFESSGRYFGPGSVHSPAARDTEQYGRSRTGSLLGAAVSTPNLHGSAPAPPLPPINPRRKNGFPRGSDEDGSGTENSTGVLGTTDIHAGDSDEHYRNFAHGSEQRRQSPPRVVRQLLPISSISNATMPGGMI